MGSASKLSGIAKIRGKNFKNTRGTPAELPETDLSRFIEGRLNNAIPNTSRGILARVLSSMPSSYSVGERSQVFLRKMDVPDSYHFKYVIDFRAFLANANVYLNFTIKYASVTKLGAISDK